MTQFMEINFHDFSLENGSTIPSNICVCCLSKATPFIRLINCKHAAFFENILKYKMETDIHICLFCHKMVEKYDLFRRQVEESFAILSDRANTTKVTKMPLQRSKLELNWTTNNQPIENETRDQTTNQEVEIQTEIKIEHDFSDFENDVPLAQIKTKTKKIKKKDVTKKKMPLQKKYENALRTIVLSEEEMLLERKEESLRQGYLKLPYKCEDCISGFDHEITLKEHLESRHQKKKGGFECNICKSVLGTKTSFDEHKKRHYRRYECVECCKRYNNIYSVLKHYNELHGKIDTQFACDLCDFVTESHRSYRYHKDKHRKAKVECDQCGNTFVNKTGLRVHMYTIHGHSARVYACDICGKRYRARSGLAAHAASHRATPAYCEQCNAHFRTPHGLKHHLRTHSRHVGDADLKFKCNECGSKFLTKSLLQEHVDWIHLNKIKHECNKCSKVFKNASSLKKHIEFVHEKKRPPRDKICDHCGRGFTTLSILQSHIRTHTGERPLRCAACPAAFAHSAARYTHARLLHRHTHTHAKGQQETV
ncbi:zinc finger protein 711-like [Epargyreus clarus]|uniref:zinc finger protein 711-like n=1 Tax=Epargyreus clarus TaxID=520877 RepID=UPI003C2EE35E